MPEAERYVPAEPPRVAVAGDGTLAAIIEPSQITVVELPSGIAFAQIGVDPEAESCTATWVGAPPRLLVLASYSTGTIVHLLDTRGPRTIAEVWLESGMRLAATVGPSALVLGGHAAVLTATETTLMPSQFLARSLPSAAGPAAGQFVVALTGAIEEWDPQTRTPKRRLRLARTAPISAVGGSERLVWLTTPSNPARVDVIPLVNRGQPKHHDLPEPIVAATGHPRSDLLACIGESGRLYVVDLDGRQQLRTAAESLPRVAAAGLIVGRMTGIIAAEAGQPLQIVPLAGRELDAEAAAALAAPSAVLPRRKPSGLPPAEPTAARVEPAAHAESAEPAELTGTPSSLSSPPAGRAGSLAAASASPAASPTSSPSAPASAAPSAAAVGSPARSSVPSLSIASSAPASSAPADRAAPASIAAGTQPIATKPASSAPSVRERFTAWRDQIRQRLPAELQSAVQAVAAMPARPARSWRDEAVAWFRSTPTSVPSQLPEAPLIGAALARFDLQPQLQPVLLLLYGAHLCGQRGVAPVDLAQLLDGQWDEALGRGALAHHHIADYAGSRVELSPTIQRMLDELPPITGTLIGEPGTTALPGPRIVVATDEPMLTIAARCLPHTGGAILVGHPTAEPAAVLHEACAYGAVAMLSLTTARDSPSVRAIYVVDAALAETLVIPHLI